MKAKVPMSDTGSARAGIRVAARLFRNRKMTMMTKAIDSNSVNCTSSTDWRIETERSFTSCAVIEGGNCAWYFGRRARI